MDAAAQSKSIRACRSGLQQLNKQLELALQCRAVANTIRGKCCRAAGMPECYARMILIIRTNTRGLAQPEPMRMTGFLPNKPSSLTKSIKSRQVKSSQEVKSNEQMNPSSSGASPGPTL